MNLLIILIVTVVISVRANSANTTVLKRTNNLLYLVIYSFEQQIQVKRKKGSIKEKCFFLISNDMHYEVGINFPFNLYMFLSFLYTRRIKSELRNMILVATWK